MKFEIKGDSLPVVICQLTNGEKMVTQSGAMSWMSPTIKMETSTNGGIGKAIGRIFTGESIFLNTFTCESLQGMITFASKLPGAIVPLQIAPGKEMIVQKSAFLASEAGVELSLFFRKKLSTGFFGGEGFIMQKLSGNGTAFLEIDGSVTEYDLGIGEQIIISTGCLAAMESSCTMEIKSVSGIKNMFFGGEGFFNTVVKGPGKVYLQSMPIAQMAMTLYGFMPHPSGSGSGGGIPFIDN